MAAGLTFAIKGDSSSFVNSVKKAEKAIGGLNDRVRGFALNKLSSGLGKAAAQMNSFTRSGKQRLAVAQQVDKLNKKLADLEKRKNNVKLNLKAATALAKFKGLQDQMRVLQSKPVTVKVLAEQKDLIAKLKSTRTRLRTFQSEGALVNLRLNSSQATKKVAGFKSELKRIKTQEIKLNFAKQEPLNQYLADVRKLKIQAGLVKFTGLGMLKGKSVVFDKMTNKVGKLGAALAGKLGTGLSKASAFFAKAAISGGKLNKTLAVIGVVGARALKVLFKSAVMATRALLKLANAGRKLVAVGFSKIKGVAFAGIKAGAIAATAAVTGLMVALKKSVEVAASLEQLQVQFTSITGSPDDAVDMVKHLREESKRTGVEISAMAVMMRRLLASGMDVSEAKKMTASLLDISGALGLTSEESKLLGVALSQVKAKGIASMEELRQQISEKGVEIFKVLEQKLGKKGKDLFDMIAAGAVGADVVVDAFMNLEGPLARFRGGTDRMAATFTGSLRRMKAQIIDTFAVLGKPFLSGLSSAMDEVRKKVKALEPEIKKITDRAGSVVGVLVEAFKGGRLGEMIKLSLIVAGKAMVSTVVAGLKAGFVGASIILKNAFTKITDKNFWLGVADLLSSTFKMIQVAMMEIALMFNPFGREEKEKRMYTLLAQATSEDARGMDRINNSGNAKPIDVIFNEAGQEIKKVIKEMINNPAMDGTKEQMKLNEIFELFKGIAKKAEEERNKRMNEVVGADEMDTVDSAKDKTDLLALKPVVSSLQRVGGGKIAGLGVLDQKRNALLKSIDHRLANWTGAVYV